MSRTRTIPFDPRLRILFTVACTAVILALHHHTVLFATAAALGVAAALDAGIGVRVLRRRLLAVNAFCLMLIVLLPWSIDGAPLLQWHSLVYSREGLLDAARMAIKANAVVLLATLLLTPVEPLALGQAVAQLGAPQRLVQLYMLTLRYLRVLEDEYRRLRTAMLVRGFQARADLHTLRTFGYLVGMLLIRALDRAERIWQAMLCRGFTGTFPQAHALRLTFHDAIIAAAVIAASLAAVGADVALPW